jgi:hypothetical protein
LRQFMRPRKTRTQQSHCRPTRLIGCWIHVTNATRGGLKVKRRITNNHGLS